MNLHSSLLPLALLATPCYAQNRPMVLLDTTVGFEGALGYKLPTILEGVSFELPFKKRFELQSTIDGGSTRKEITNDGLTFRTRTQFIYWVNNKFGAFGGLGTSDLWTSQFNKSATTTLFGVVFKNHFGPVNQPGTLAGRVYVSYLLPTGCQWATNSNPCTLQSSRLQGVQLYPEWRITRNLRFGIRMAVLHGLEQGNPKQPSAGRIGYVTFSSDVVLRFQFPGAKYYEAY